jgi:hypothetical protein
MKIAASVSVPVLPPLHHPKGDDRFPACFGAAWRAILGMTDKIVVWEEWLNRPAISISLSDDAADRPELAAVWTPQPHLAYAFLWFDIDFHFDVAAFLTELNTANETHHLTMQQAKQIAQDTIPEYLAKAVADLVMASQIAQPDCLRPQSLYLFTDRRLVRVKPGLGGDVQFIVSAARELGWPPIRALSLDDTWQWLSRIPGFSDGEPRGPVGRAVSALSHILHKDAAGGVAGSLMWAMVGLEALYCRGSAALREQLLAKSEILLGPRTDNKRAFSRVYDVRSRFIHGDIDMPVSYYAYDTDESGFGDDTYDSFQLAAATLLASLQELALRNTIELEFTYSLKQAPADGV